MKKAVFCILVVVVMLCVNFSAINAAAKAPKIGVNVVLNADITELRRALFLAAKQLLPPGGQAPGTLP